MTTAGFPPPNPLPTQKDPSTTFTTGHHSHTGRTRALLSWCTLREKAYFGGDLSVDPVKGAVTDADNQRIPAVGSKQTTRQHTSLRPVLSWVKAV